MPHRQAAQAVAEGGPKRLYADSVTAPGVTKEEDGQPDWPPEKSACLATMPEILKLLQEFSYHRAHGVVPSEGLKTALARLGYDRCQALPIPASEGFSAAVHSSTSSDIPALVTVKAEHECRCMMWIIGRGPRTGAARSLDSSEAWLRTMIDDKPYVVEGRLHAVVENSCGVLQGGKTWMDICDEWSQKVYGRGFNELEVGEKAVVLTALEGVACYGRNPIEWSRLQAPYTILFADSPEIVRVVQGPFDTNKAGKQIRASQAGDTRARLSREATEERAKGHTGPITTTDGRMLHEDWMTLAEAGTASAKSMAKYWSTKVVNDLGLGDNELFGMLSCANLLGPEAVRRIMADRRVSVFKHELTKANSAAGDTRARLSREATEERAKGHTGPITTTDGRVLHEGWMTLAEAAVLGGQSHLGTGDCPGQRETIEVKMTEDDDWQSVEVLKIGGPTANGTPGGIQFNTPRDANRRFNGTLLEAMREDNVNWWWVLLRIDGVTWRWNGSYKRKKKGGGHLVGRYEQQ